MPHFKTKPLFVEAFKWYGATIDFLREIEEVHAWLKENNETVIVEGHNLRLSNGIYVKPHDWIVKGIDGKFYRMSHEMFVRTFVLVSLSAVQTRDLDKIDAYKDID